jgi:mono/diheme cytochrome c family protein
MDFFITSNKIWAAAFLLVAPVAAGAFDLDGDAQRGEQLYQVQCASCHGPEVNEVIVKIIGNSYYPKAIEIEPGTRVTWVNEEVFTYMAGGPT